MHLITGLLLGEMILGNKILSKGRAAGAPFELVHVLAGRLRVRVHALKGNVRLEQQITAALGEVPGVTQAQADARTGSVLVLFDEKPEVRQALIEQLQRLSLAGQDTAAKRPLPEVPWLRQGIQELGKQANSHLMVHSHGATDLTTLLGLAALVWGTKTVVAPVGVSRWQGMTLLYWGYNIMRR
jgi:copper chaperone CopZ